MHTYSGITPQEYYDAIRAGNPIHFEMYFSDQNVTITEENININYGVVITDVINGDNDLVVGKVVCKQLETRIILNDDLRYIKWKDRFRVRFGVEINGSTKWVVIGYFNGVKPKNVQTATEMDYVAYDDVIKFELPVNNFLEELDDDSLFPISTFDLVRKIGQYAGVSMSDIPYLGGSSAVADTEMTKANLKNFKTLREMLAAIAEASCTYAKMHNGVCCFEWYGDEQYNYGKPGYNDFPIIVRTDQFSNDHEDLYNGMTWDEFEYYRWNSAENLTWDFVTGSYAYTNALDTIYMEYNGSVADTWRRNTPHDDRTYSVIGNVFTKETYIYPAITYANKYLDRLYNFGGQLPMIVECTGNWCIEAGDYVDVVIEHNEVIHMPVYMHTLYYNGGITSTLETTGEMFNKFDR